MKKIKESNKSCQKKENKIWNKKQNREKKHQKNKNKKRNKMPNKPDYRMKKEFNKRSSVMKMNFKNLKMYNLINDFCRILKEK